MKVSVLINNYNYHQYVSDAINSALNQSVQPDEVIVVDDGSTDQSAQVLRERFQNHERVKLILKEKNEGHLSCFNVGFQASFGDIVFFLDADDVYKPTYIEEALQFYKKHPKCDFLFCDFERFGEAKGNRGDYKYNRDLGYSTIATIYRHRWLGSITTTISARRHLLENILPVPYLSDWLNGAENCLVYGASLLGARKFYLAQPLVQYRLHRKNDHYTRNGRVDNRRFDRLSALFLEKMAYPDDLYKQADAEFLTIPKPLYKELRLYLNIIKRHQMPRLQKIKMALFMFGHFVAKGDFFSRVPEWHL